jgi:integrase
MLYPSGGTMQKGAIRKHGKFWQLKYRGYVLKNGVKVRKDLYADLAPIDREHQTENSVRALADVILAPLNAGTHQATSVDSVKSFLESFLTKGEGGRGHKLRQSTIDGYEDMYKLAKPHLLDLELRKVRTPDINQIMRAVAAGDEDGDRRAQTVYYNLKNFLSSAFRYAVGHGLVDSNPVRDAIIPQGADSDTYAYSLEEIHQIMEVVQKPMAKAAIMVATFTGLRMSEIKGLRWEDYDGDVLNVRRGVVKGIVGDTKTKTSKASIPIVNILKKVLAVHLKNNSGDGYIFHGETGEPIRFENLARRDIIPRLAGKKVEWHGLHACRRGLSSILHDKGVDVLVVKHILRQSVEGVAEKHYIKPSLKRMRKALELVEKQYLKIQKKSRR